MGEMVMNNIFSRDNFDFASFNVDQRRQNLIVSLGLGLFFIFAAFTFMNALYCFADAIGSIVSGSPDVAMQDFLRSVPIFLSFFMTQWFLLFIHAFFRNVSEEKLKRSIKKNTIAIIIFAGVNIIYIIYGLIAGRYLSLVEGAPSPLFPLDAMLYSLLFLALGILGLVYGIKLRERIPYLVPTRGSIVRKGRFGYCLIVALWMLVAIYSFAAFWTGLFVIDFTHGYLAFSIALLVVFLVNWLFFACWEFFYNQVKEEKRKDVLLPLAIIGLIVALAAALFYFAALSFNLDGPSKVGFGVLPVAFAASVNFATLLVVAAPIIVSVVALIKGIVLRKRG